jgi:hypothetical protein
MFTLQSVTRLSPHGRNLRASACGDDGAPRNGHLGEGALLSGTDTRRAVIPVCRHVSTGNRNHTAAAADSTAAHPAADACRCHSAISAYRSARDYNRPGILSVTAADAGTAIRADGHEDAAAGRARERRGRARRDLKARSQVCARSGHVFAGVQIIVTADKRVAAGQRHYGRGPVRDAKRRPVFIARQVDADVVQNDTDIRA